MEYKLKRNKIIKLNVKAQKCVSRKKAQKLLRKYEKAQTAPEDPTRCHDTLV